MYSTMNTRGGSARHTRRATGGEWRPWPGCAATPAGSVPAALSGARPGAALGSAAGRSAPWSGPRCV